MSLLQILYYPDQRLRTIAKPVKKIDNNICQIIYNMLHTMYTKQGIGLAATQINIHQQIIVIDISEKKNQPLILINPEYIKKNGTIKTKEGCLSIPNQRNFISRYKYIKITTSSLSGKKFELEAENLLAVCIQHEMDHLIGKLFIDYLSKLKIERLNLKIAKLKHKNKKNKNHLIYI